MKNLFVFPIFIFLKNIKIKKLKKILNLKNKEEFLDNTFLLFFVFLKTILKKSLKKYEPNML